MGVLGKWVSAIRKSDMQRRWGPVVAVSLVFSLGNASVSAADLHPIGPELAPRESGVLLKAYPLLTQNNPGSPLGIGVLLWGCKYLVGKSKITITITTQPSDSMPCKRRVAFGKSN